MSTNTKWPVALFRSTLCIITLSSLAIPAYAQTAPTMGIMSPATPVSLSFGQSQTFSAEATAGSGIRGIEWFVGSASHKYTSHLSSWVYYTQESFSYTFNTPGTYQVSAYVYDRESPQRKAFVTWTVNVTEPQLSSRPDFEFFDDFNYSSVVDTALSNFGWSIRTYPGGPGVDGAIWSKNRVTFIANPQNTSDKILRMSARTRGTAGSTEHAELSTQRRFFEGTYAVRARVTDLPQYGPSIDGVVQAPLFAISDYYDPNYSEVDFEYLPKDVWSGATRIGPTMYMTSWASHAENSHDHIQQSFSEWRTFLFQVTEGHVRFYIDGIEDPVATHTGSYYPKSMMYVMIQIWFTNENLSSDASEREWAMDIDWIYHAKDVALNVYYVESFVQEIRNESLSRLDTLSTLPSAPTGVAASDGTFVDKVRVTWNSSSGTTSYEVWRNTSNNSGSSTRIGNDLTTTTYDDTSAVAGTTYYYWLKAKNAGGTSGFSSSDSGYRQVNPPTNSPPILRPIGNKSIQSYRTLNFTIGADDDDGDPLQYSATGAP